MYEIKLKATKIHKYYGKSKKETITMESDEMKEFYNCLYRSSNFLRASHYSELANKVATIINEKVPFKKSFHYISNNSKDIKNIYKATISIQEID